MATTAEPKPASNYDDPEWRIERARKAAHARNSVQAHCAAIARKLPTLTADEASAVGRLAEQLDARLSALTPAEQRETA